MAVIGPDFEIPPDPPPPLEGPPDEAPRRASLAQRITAVLLVALLGLSGAGAFAWWYATGRASPPPPPATDDPISTTEPPETRPGSRSPSSTAPAARATRTPTCLASEEDAGAAREAPSETPPWITFDFSPRVGSDALVRIVRAASEARDAFGEAGALTVHLHCDIEQYAAASNTPVEEARTAIERGGYVYIRGPDIWIYGPGYDRSSSVDKRQTIYHEYFHAVQRFLSRNRSSRSDVERPLWLIEGSAEYFENALMPRDLDAFRTAYVRRWDDLPSLGALEDAGGARAIGGSGAAYTVGSVAADYLVTTYGRERLQYDYWVALASSDWQTAFHQVFGLTVDQFYAEFEAYRRTLRP